MTEKEFRKWFKILQRFLKEEGLYTAVLKNLLFKNGRKKESLFNAFNSKRFSYTGEWQDLFIYGNLMIGEEHFDEIIDDFWENDYRIIREKDLDVKWRSYLYNLKNKI